MKAHNEIRKGRYWYSQAEPNRIYDAIGFFVNDDDSYTVCLIMGMDTCWVCDHKTKEWWIVPAHYHLSEEFVKIGPFDTWEDAATHSMLLME